MICFLTSFPPSLPCRDAGLPLKGRDAHGQQVGPLISGVVAGQEAGRGVRSSRRRGWCPASPLDLAVHQSPSPATYCCHLQCIVYAEPEVACVALDELSEFFITASDGLWDYYRQGEGARIAKTVCRRWYRKGAWGLADQ